MKILLPATGNEGEKAHISNRFGRAQYLAIYDGKDYKIVENSATRAMGGAGVQTSQHVVNQNIDVLIARNIGPKAWQVLSASNIDIYEGIDGSLAENIEAYNDNRLKRLKTATNSGGVYK
ncbi:MAG: NifB/NifX family molybdenum-iron cluster-binding protein [Clostridia bacterium]